MDKRHLTICLALTLTATPAHADNIRDFAQTLDESSVKAFVEELRAVSTGQDADAAQGDAAAYLKNHLADKGSFRSKTTYEMPGYPVQEVEMEFQKSEFIDNIANGNGLLQDYETSVAIEDLNISNGGRSATFKAKISEKGRIPWPDGRGGQEMVPIKGSSDCQEKVIVSLNNYMQLADADCATTISFAPFDKPLGE